IFVTVSLIFLSLLAQSYFGGLRYFNLNIMRVYEFRGMSADEVPSIFGYIFSDVSNVLIPIALILSIRFKNYVTAFVVVCGAVFLFGMTHHKTVLFMPFIIVVIYMCFSYYKRTYVIGFVFLLIAFICISEVVYIRYILDSSKYIAY